MSVSRRDLFRSLLKKRPAAKPARVTRSVPPPATPLPKPKAPAPTGEVALIHQHFCLAWQGSFCSVCSERCPEPGAIVVEKGKPTVDTDRCTGCRVCQDVCPAPRKAVFTVARQPKVGMNCDWGWERKDPSGR